MTEKQKRRFWAKVLKTDTCWIWQGAKDKDGYGVAIFVGEPRRKTHQLAYEDQVGPIPEGLGVLHHCDNPPCVRPDHLFLGTNQINLADMRAKGRQVKGETHGRRKLTEADVANIKALKAEHVTQCAIAKWYGISDSAVSNIINGKRWKHLA
jgi:hypothetical protein